MRKKIYISPSSQPSNTYASGKTNEQAQCRRIALATVEALKRCGFEAKTNVTDGKTMYDRVRESNSWSADLHVPIHTNAFNKKLMGTRMFCSSVSGEGYKACKAIMAELAPITPGNSDSITAQKTLYEVYKPKAATAYIEVAFHDNAEEARWIIDNTEAIAEAICKGVCNHYGVKYIAPVAKPSTDPKEKYIYRVQVGAYSNPSNAESMLDKLEKAGFTGVIVKDYK